MNRIAIIDDNFDHRETLRHAIEAYLEKKQSSLEVIDIYPFTTNDFHEYIEWIEKEDIVLLILDERMHNESEDGKGPVGYRGNELVQKIRTSYKTIPIFTITSHADDAELLEKLGEFDHIISRSDFYENGPGFVDIMLRSTQRFIEENEAELADFGELTKKAASGQISNEEITRLKAIQAKLQLPLSDFTDREEWLNQYEDHIGELEKYRNELKSFLEKE